MPGSNAAQPCCTRAIAHPNRLLAIRGAAMCGAKTDTIHARGLAANPPDLAPCGRAARQAWTHSSDTRDYRWRAGQIINLAGGCRGCRARREDVVRVRVAGPAPQPARVHFARPSPRRSRPSGHARRDLPSPRTTRHLHACRRLAPRGRSAEEAHLRRAHTAPADQIGKQKGQWLETPELVELLGGYVPHPPDGVTEWRWWTALRMAFLRRHPHS